MSNLALMTPVVVVDTEKNDRKVPGFVVANSETLEEGRSFGLAEDHYSVAVFSPRGNTNRTLTGIPSKAARKAAKKAAKAEVKENGYAETAVSRYYVEAL